MFRTLWYLGSIKRPNYYSESISNYLPSAFQRFEPLGFHGLETGLGVLNVLNIQPKYFSRKFAGIPTPWAYLLSEINTRLHKQNNGYNNKLIIQFLRKLWVTKITNRKVPKALKIFR